MEGRGRVGVGDMEVKVDTDMMESDVESELE